MCFKKDKKPFVRGCPYSSYKSSTNMPEEPNVNITFRSMFHRDVLQKIVAEPEKVWEVGIALLRGWLIKVRYALNPNITIGSNFRAYTWIRISGPGKVVIGDKVSMHLSFLRRPCILTHTKESIVTIGNGCIINGARISCVDVVTIGDEVLLGSSTIIDSDIIPTKDIIIDAQWKERHVQPIKICNHVWAGLNSFILRGSILGDECVLGAGAVIQYKNVPERSVLVGNPARKVGLTRTV